MGGSSCGNFGGIPWGCHGHWLGVGNLVVCLGVVMDTGLAQGSIGTSEPVWRGPGVVPWADCRLGTNELIGEDPPVIIRLGANQ